MCAASCPWNDANEELLRDCHARAVALNRRMSHRAARRGLEAHALAACGFVGGVLGAFLVVGASGVPPGVVCALSMVAALSSAVAHTARSPSALAARATERAATAAAIALDASIALATPRAQRDDPPEALLRALEARIGACLIASEGSLPDAAAPPA